ncbi:MAG: hypothetical protein RLZZ303_1339 [Candidatus Hydrogenedentota bacterium]|jgi:hypothetical protein
MSAFPDSSSENPDKMKPVLGNDMNQCMTCKHLTKIGAHFNGAATGWKCAAFGDHDIPTTIVRGFHDHRDPWPKYRPDRPGDGGIQYEPVED